MVSDPVNGLGIPFMMVGLILLAFCMILFAIVSYLTPRPLEIQLTNLCWDKPFQAITQGKITGITDPRVMAATLLIIMIVLYTIFA